MVGETKLQVKNATIPLVDIHLWLGRSLLNSEYLRGGLYSKTTVTILSQITKDIGGARRSEGSYQRVDEGSIDPKIRCFQASNASKESAKKE
ncbi:hypothetical protein ACU8KH_01360 [Lachancea thermotolerans]